MTGPGPEALLLGPLSRDVYLPGGEVLPGGGVLNMAYHWRTLGLPFRLLTRIGTDDPGLFLAFLDRHGIPCSPRTIVASGTSASIDVEILPDRQPHMDHFVEGVWAGFRLRPGEERLLADAGRLHAVLVEGAVAEVHRLGEGGLLRHLAVSADFLGFRHYTIERMARTMALVDVGFVGWPGAPDDPVVGGMREIAFDGRRLLVVTMGARSVRVFDGRGAPYERTFPVTPVPVRGTTLGCGDAFIAYFLAELWRTGDVALAIERGKLGGALATAWARPLPDDAYDVAISSPSRP